MEDQEDDQVIQILAHMIETKATSRWAPSRCLAHGFKSGMFKKRVADSLIACASDSDDLDLPTEEENGKKDADCGTIAWIVRQSLILADAMV